MHSWHSYPSIYNLGHKAVKDLLTVPHYIEEKVDGSQFSFGLFEIEGEKVLKVRSKGSEMLPDAPEKMFSKAVATVKDLQDKLHLGWTYRAEYLRVPHHNTLIYNRTPNKHIVIFDISTGEEEWLSPFEVREEAKRLELESVPIIAIDYKGGITSYESIRGYLAIESFLGGNKIEGVVVKQLGEHNPNKEQIKPYLLGYDKKTLIGKFVSEAFKESHKEAWKDASPKTGDVVEKLVKGLTTTARWHKAVQHLQEKGLLENSPRDIPKVIREIQADVMKEEEEAIKDALFSFAKPTIERGVVKGVAEWYKEELLKKQFS